MDVILVMRLHAVCCIALCCMTVMLYCGFVHLLYLLAVFGSFCKFVLVGVVCMKALSTMCCCCVLRI